MEEDAKKLRSLLEDVIERLPLDRETGIMLSGGLDSSALACILLNKGKRVRSIAASFRSITMYDETMYLDTIKKMYPQLEVNSFTPIDIDLIDELRKLMKILQEPIVSGSHLLQYLLLKKAAELGFRNLLYGQWPDELMGGYDTFLLDRARDDLIHMKLADAFVNIREYIQRAKMVKTNLIILRLLKNTLTSRGLRNSLAQSIPNLRYLLDIAHKTAKAVGVRLILPYEDPEIAEFCRLLDVDRLVFRGQTKIILREAVSDILPQEIINRRMKFGFYPPDAVWFKRNRDSIESLKNRDVDREYRKFLRNPEKRWYKALWKALSNAVMAG